MAAQPQETPDEYRSEAAPVESGPQHLRPVPDPEPNTPEPAAESEASRAVPPEPSTDIPEPAESDQDTDEQQGMTDRLRAQIVAWLSGLDVVQHDRPSLAKVWRYARYTEQLPPDGPLRVAALAYAYGVALPAYTAAYGVAWLVERPARAGVAAALVTLAALFGPTRWGLTVLLFVPDLALTLLTY